MALPGLADETTKNIVIQAPILNSTKVAFSGAFVVGLVTPILAFVSGQPEAIQQMALLISLAAIPSVAVVVAADSLARGYVTAHKPVQNAKNTDSAEPTGLAVFNRDVLVKVAGEGDQPFHVIAMRRGGTGKEELFLARGRTLKWYDEKDVDQFVAVKS